MSGHPNRLRDARTAAGLSLAELAERTRISPTMLRHLDEGRFDRLPAGIYARAWVRSYAEAVGLDPDRAVGELAGRLPGIEGWGDGDRPPREPGLRPAPPLRRDDERNARRAAPDVQPLAVASAPALRRFAAGAIDAAVLAAAFAGLASVTVGAAGTTAEAFTLLEGVAVATTIAVVAALYFTVFAGIGDGTPGALAAGLGDAARSRRLQPSDILSRAWAAFESEASILLDLAFEVDWAVLLRRRLDA